MVPEGRGNHQTDLTTPIVYQFYMVETTLYEHFEKTVAA
jgi:hypothetical protein